MMDTTLMILLTLHLTTLPMTKKKKKSVPGKKEITDLESEDLVRLSHRPGTDALE